MPITAWEVPKVFAGINTRKMYRNVIGKRLAFLDDLPLEINGNPGFRDFYR